LAFAAFLLSAFYFGLVVALVEPQCSLRVASGYTEGILRVASGCLPVAYQMA